MRVAMWGQLSSQLWFSWRYRRPRRRRFGKREERPARPGSPSVAMTSLANWSDPPLEPRRSKGPRLSWDFHGASRALNRMHGEESRLAVRPPSGEASEGQATFGKTHRIRAKYLQHRESVYNPDYKSNPSRATMKIGLTALALRPGCVLHVFFVQKKGDRLRAIVDWRKANVLFAPPPSVELPTGDGLSRIEDTSGLTCSESLGLHNGCADVADCFYRMRLSGDIRRYFGWPGRSNKYLKVTEVEGAKVSPSQTLWPMCCSLPMGFSWSLHSAQSANRARLNRPSSPLRSAETTDREPPLALGHHLNADNWTRAREIPRRIA